MNPNYEKILYRSRPLSKHPSMSRKDRAAQFAPFAALSGHEESLAEIRRMTEEKRILLDDSQQELKQFFDELYEKQNLKPLVSLTYFVADPRKSGGYYHTIQTNIKKFEEATQSLLTIDGIKIPIKDVSEGYFL